MTKDELIDKLKYLPSDVRILIYSNNDITNGYYGIDNRITFFADVTPKRVPCILLTIDKEIDVTT